jgi:lipopolysaccharide transport system permease protein
MRQGARKRDPSDEAATVAPGMRVFPADRGAAVAVEGAAVESRRLGRRSLRTYVIEPRKHSLRAAFVELWHFRWCIPYFGGNALHKRYKRTWLGFLWVPLKPGYNIASKMLIFGGVLGVSAGKTPYPIFFLISNAVWQLFAETAFWSTRSLELARGALRKLELPRLPVLASSLLSGSVEFFVYLVFAALGLGYYMARKGGFHLEFTRRSIYLVPAGLFFVVAIGIGIGLLLSGLGSRARDIRLSISWGLSFLQYVTPVLYPLSKIPPHWRPLAEANPVTGAIQMVKDGVFATHELTQSATLVTVVATLVLWIPGLWFFHRADVQERRAHS